MNQRQQMLATTDLASKTISLHAKRIRRVEHPFEINAAKNKKKDSNGHYMILANQAMFYVFAECPVDENGDLLNNKNQMDAYLFKIGQTGVRDNDKDLPSSPYQAFVDRYKGQLSATTHCLILFGVIIFDKNRPLAETDQMPQESVDRQFRQSLIKQYPDRFKAHGKYINEEIVMGLENCTPADLKEKLEAHAERFFNGQVPYPGADLIRQQRTRGSFDTNQPYTPTPMVKRLVDPAIANRCLSASIAVVYTVEIAAYLVFLGFKNITVVTKDYDRVIKNDAKRFGFSYKLLKEVERTNDMFDVICGNPPYENDMDKRFMEFAAKRLNGGGHLVYLVPSAFLTQPSKDGWREEFTKTVGLKSIELHPIGAFTTYGGKFVLRQVALLVGERGYNGSTTYTRTADGKKYTTVVQINGTREPVWHFYGDVSRSIWEKAMAYRKKMNVQWWKSSKQDGIDKSYVHFCEKTDAHYIEGTGKYNVTRPYLGRNAHTSVIASVNGNNRPTAEQLKSKRGYIRTSQPGKLREWMGTNIYGLLLTIATTTQDITARSVGMMPMVITPGPFSVKAVYDELGLTKAEREWLKDLFGNDH